MSTALSRENTIEFVAIKPMAAAIDKLTGELSSALESGKRVLWLVSGGSSVVVAAEVAKRLPASQKLLVMQVDERYGLPDHPDANWRRLVEAGFEASKFVCVPMLGDNDFETIIKQYDALLGRAFAESGFTVGLFGIGADGHTAGLLPGSAALASTELVAGFQGPDYQRITMTAPAIGRLDLAVAFAVGADKEPALKQLKEAIAVSDQPAQALKLAKRVIVYNDFING